MTTTAQQIIEAGFARSTASDAGKLAVDGEMINNLNRRYQSMFAMMAKYQPDNVSASTTLTFASSPATVALPTDIINILRVEQQSGARAYLYKATEKDRTYLLSPGVYRRGNSLVTIGGASDPVAGTVWNLIYNDAPATLSVLASTLDTRFPVRYENILILDQAVYLSIKDEGRDAQRIAALKGEFAQEYKFFLDAIGASNTATESATPQPSTKTA